MRAKTNRFIPPELIEGILLKLPAKSLLRFSSISTSWNSMILKPDFAKRYRRRAAARERIAVVTYGGGGKGSTFHISSISSQNPTAVATDFLCPFGMYVVLASSDDMWLAVNGRSLVLWNPSTRKYKELHSLFYEHGWEKKFVLGLGYESVGDDYKILKIPRKYGGGVPPPPPPFELYSLRSDSWRAVRDRPTKGSFEIERCLFLQGKLYWMSYKDGSIMCFDLTTERFGELALSVEYTTPYSIEEMSVVSGMLCVSVECGEGFDIWVMEEKGMSKLWTKKFSIDQNVNGLRRELIYPLHLYENGEILIRVSERRRDRMYVCKDERSREEVDISCCRHSIIIRYDQVYVDSLFLPTSFSSGYKCILRIK